MVNHNYTVALAELSKQSSVEAIKARNFKKSPENYFRKLDLRILAFYYTAYYSNIWNAEIFSKISASQAKATFQTVNTIQYQFLPTYEELASMFILTTKLKNIRVTEINGKLDSYEYHRPTLVQAKIIFEQYNHDNLNNHKAAHAFA